MDASKIAASNAAARDTWERKAVGGKRAHAPAGTPEYFEQVRTYRYGYETPFIPATFRFSDLAGKRVLEIGVGLGIDAIEMMRNGCVYTGLDITQNHLNLTRRHIEVESREKQLEALIDGDLLTADLQDNYDVIYSFGVLHHIAHEGEYLEKLRQLLKPGGELRVGVYSKYSFFNAYLLATWLLKNRRRNSFDDWRSHVAEHSELGNPVTIKIRSRRGVQKVLEKAGFRVDHYEKRGFVQNYLPIIGSHLAPGGAVLRAFAAVLGWYHCFICTSDNASR